VFRGVRVTKTRERSRSVSERPTLLGVDVDEPLASRPAIVAVGPFTGGTIGVVSGALVIEWLDPGLPDMTMEMLIGMNVGGGAGWVAGGAIGWLGGRNRPSPRWTTRVVLLALIAPMVLLGMAASQRLGTAASVR
jgi:hypothetical protein